MEKRKGLITVLSLAMIAALLPWQVSPVHAASLNGYIQDSDLSLKGTTAPVSDKVLPDAMQYEYQKDELAAFCHFGPNTFNEVEWGEGYGNSTPDEIFKLGPTDDFDAETLVKTLKDAGFKKLIVTAKHHDGFCIWNSQYTDYDVAATDYKNGHGDILEEISTACSDEDMDMGLYLSPWDIHDKSYGYYDSDRNALVDGEGNPKDGMSWEEVEEKDVYDYNEYYNNQLQEILGNEKYGNKGKFVEIWMDGAKGSGNATQNYTFNEWFKTIQDNEGLDAQRKGDCLLFGSGAKTTVRWIGNEFGFAPEENWAQSKLIRNSEGVPTDVDTGWNESTGFSPGFPDGDVWTVPECDARITSGWFWGHQKSTPKTMEELAEMYFKSVGHNATLLLNVPPNDQGKIDNAIQQRIIEFGAAIKESFKTNQVKDKTVYANTVLGNDKDYSPANVIDDNQDTYWTPEAGQNSGSLVVDLGSDSKFDVVSIEEAIQKGQRINKFKVEYSSDATNWTTMGEGTTIGSKRLVRTKQVTARYVKITVETEEGKVPLLTEIGVYKVTDDFSINNGVPEGLKIVGNTDKDTTDKFGFEYSDKWNQETGSQYLNETNMWIDGSKEAGELTLKFHGTKVWLVGTTANNQGDISISIDGGEPVTVNTKSEEKITGCKLFTSEDLSDTDHTLTMTTKGVIGIEGALVLDNDGQGMFEFKEDNYEFDEAEPTNDASNIDTMRTNTLNIKRVGGTKGQVSVLVENNPGTAMQGNYDATRSGGEIVFEDGETEKTVNLYTKYDSRIQGNTMMTMNLVNPKGGVVGFAKKATVTIKDKDTRTKEQLKTSLDKAKALQEHLYSYGWENLLETISLADEIYADTASTDVKYGETVRKIDSAILVLGKRSLYTTEDPFKFPLKSNENTIAEIEFGTIENVSNTPDILDESWPIQRDPYKDWASNNTVVTCIHATDTITIPYTAPRTGKYKVVLTYGNSGNPENGIIVTEQDGKIDEVSVTAGSDDSTKTGLTVEFEINVKTAGAGTLVLTGGTAGASGLDKITVTPKELAYEKVTVTTSVTGHGSIASSTGSNEFIEFNDATYTMTPDKGYKIKDVKVNGESVGAVESYTIEGISANTTIDVEFEFAYYNPTEPFTLPAEAGVAHKVTLEAEQNELKNTGPENEEWKLGIYDADWAGNGKIVNCFNNGDTMTIYYNAPHAGIYQMTAYYRSGGPNKLVWAGENVDAGEVEASGIDASVTRKVTFNVNINKAGTGSIVFTAPESNSPQLDRFDICYYGTQLDLDKEALSLVIAQAKEEVAKTTVYKPYSIQQLQDAITKAEGIYNDSTKDSSALNAAKEELQGVIDALKTILNLDALNATIEKAQAIVDDLQNYVAESVDGLKDLLAQAKALVLDEDGSVTQDQVDAKAATLSKAIANAMKKADIDELKKLTETCSAIDLTGYTEASQKVFTIVLRDSNKLLSENLTIKDQPVIEKMFNSLTKAKTVLTKESDLLKDDVVKVKVTFKTAGEDLVQEIIKGSTAVKPTDPVKNGFTFDGWFTDSEFKQAFDFETKIDKDLTVYAQFSLKELDMGSDLSATDTSGGSHIEVVIDEPTKKNLETAGKDIVENIMTGKDIHNIQYNVLDQKALEDAIDQGKKITVSVDVKYLDTENVSKNDQKLMKQYVGEKKQVAQYLDIKVSLTADGKDLVQITQLEQTLRLKVLIPTALKKDNRVFSIIKLHNGVVSQLPVTLDGDYLFFSTNEFSTYALVYEDKIINEGNEGNQGNQGNEGNQGNSNQGNQGDNGTTQTPSQPGQNAQTGDNSLIVIYLLLGIITMTGVIILHKKHRNQ